MEPVATETAHVIRHLVLHDDVRVQQVKARVERAKYAAGVRGGHLTTEDHVDLTIRFLADVLEERNA